jgi:division/cell wall cluster transcriptional repressor MraZ
MAVAETMPIIFANRYEHATDGQARAQVPSKWRPDSGKERYFVQLCDHRTAGRHLRFLPMEEAVRLRNELSRKGENDPGQDDNKRALASEMEIVDLDSAGRISLPEKMAKAAGIGKNETVVMAGAFSYFEVWNQARYAKVHAADEALRNQSNNKQA